MGEISKSVIPRRNPLSANVGIYSVGHHVYWSQFEGLLEEMKRKTIRLGSMLKQHDVNVIDFGISDCAESAYTALPRINGADLDLLFVDMVTYATSSTIGIIFRDVKILFTANIFLGHCKKFRVKLLE